MNRRALALSISLGAAPLALASQTADPSSNATQTIASPAAEIPATIQLGSTLELRVQGEKTFDGNYLVRRGGYIVVPSIGRVMMAGKTVNAATETIKRALLAAGLEKSDVSLRPVEQPK